MRSPFFLSLALLALAAGCGKESGSSPAATNANSSGGGVVTAPVDYLDALAKQKQNAVKTIDVAVVNKAIQQFQVEQGRNPKDIEELVQEKYLREMPQPPYGTKLVYDANSGSAKVVKE